MLALIGDMLCLIDEIQRISGGLNNKTLSNLIDNHRPHLKVYRSARNYFTHFNERIGSGMDAHGVTGASRIPGLGLEFGNEAQGCFYLVFSGASFYYHDKQRGELEPSPKSLSFDKDGLSNILTISALT